MTETTTETTTEDALRQEVQEVRALLGQRDTEIARLKRGGPYCHYSLLEDERRLQATTLAELERVSSALAAEVQAHDETRALATSRALLAGDIADQRNALAKEVARLETRQCHVAISECQKRDALLADYSALLDARRADLDELARMTDTLAVLRTRCENLEAQVRSQAATIETLQSTTTVSPTLLTDLRAWATRRYEAALAYRSSSESDEFVAHGEMVTAKALLEWLNRQTGDRS